MKPETYIVIAIGVVGLVIAYYTYQATQQAAGQVEGTSGSIEDILSAPTAAANSVLQTIVGTGSPIL